MRILYLLSEFVLPTRSGLRVREMSQLRLLASIDEVESITVLTISGEPVPEEQLNALSSMFPRVQIETPVVQPRKIRHSCDALQNFVRRRVFHSEPYLIAIYNSKEMHRVVSRQLRNNRFDVVYISYLGVSAYLDTIRKWAPGALVVLEQHNIEWRIFDRLADSLKPPMRQLVRYEAHALRNYEQQVMKHVDSVIAISGIDARELDELSGITSVVIPPYFELQAQRETVQAKPVLGYIGHLGWQPNVIGLDWFCGDVWPLVRRQLPDARLTVAGPGLVKDEKSGRVIAPGAWQREGIEVVGFVDDLNDLYNQTAAMIAPVVGGSGVRMKLLETLSAGMPTVTTPDGALGLDVEDGRELLIAGDAAGFAERVVRVLSDTQLQKSLRASGYEFLEKYHSKPVAINCFKNALRMSSDN